MQIWLTLTHALQLLSAIAMIGLVLIQHGKGADMGASFGGGSSGSLFGATGSANFLSRSTAACATVFFLSTLVLAFMSNSVGAAGVSGSSVLDRAVMPPVAASAPASSAIPSGAPTLPAASAAANAASAPASAAEPAIPTK
jgi:preprotein translocase subunit SecG